jgi:hypothetical protein
MDISQMPQLIQEQEKKSDFTVKKLGTEKILGYQTSHVRVESKEQKMEMWISKEFEVYKKLKDLMSANPQAAGQMSAFEALKEKDLHGFPLKTVVYHGKEKTEMKAVKIEEKKYPQDLFSIPQGYTKTEGFGNMLGQMGSPQNMEAMKEMMEKNMTPEQLEELRKMMEKAVQQQQQPEQ